MEFSAFENSMITIKPHITFNENVKAKTEGKMREYFKGIKDAKITDPQTQATMLVSIVENCTKSYRKRIRFQLIPPMIWYESG